MTTTADIARTRVELREHGNTLRGLCPLHDRDGRNPSFVIRENGRWRCFSCGESGDRITLAMKLYGMTFPQALEYLGESRPRPTGAEKARQTRERKQRLKAEWRERDLAWTLGVLVRVGRKALSALTPDNFDKYAEVVGAVADWERWHEVFISGSSEDRAALVKELDDFDVFIRGRLFDESFNYKAWVSEITRREGHPEPQNNDEWKIEIPVKRTESSHS